MSRAALCPLPSSSNSPSSLYFSSSLSSPFPLCFLGLPDFLKPVNNSKTKPETSKKEINYEELYPKYVSQIHELTGIPIDIQYKLYAYQHQAQLGDYSPNKVGSHTGLVQWVRGLLGLAESRKIRLWKACSGMKKMAAIKSYINLAKEFVDEESIINKDRLNFEMKRTEAKAN